MISIHAPREGSDAQCGALGIMLLISIHAPREGSDLPMNRIPVLPGHFNPRSP